MTAATLSVIKTTDESRFDQTAGFVDDPELFLPLEAGVAYWVEAVLIARVSAYYASQFRSRLQFTGSLYDPGVHVVSNSNNSYYTTAYEPNVHFQNVALSQAGLDSYQLIDNTTSTNSAFRGVVWYAGRITCVDAGNLKLQWWHSDNGFAGSSNPTTLFAGSFLYVTPLDICPI
jgi:hypothetical protein